MKLVNFSNIEALTQFKYLGNGYTSEKHGAVKLFTDKEIRVGHNYDLTIESTVQGIATALYSPYLKQMNVNRFDKVVQQHILKVFSSKFNNKYHHLNSGYFGDVSLLIRTNEAIIKPRAGARSLCTLRYSNLKYSHLNMLELITAGLKPLIANTADIKTVEDFLKHPIQQFFDKHEIKFNIGQVKDIGEVTIYLTTLVNSPSSFIIQECIDLTDVVELRIIRGVDGEVKLVSERPDLDDEYQGYSPMHGWTIVGADYKVGLDIRDEIFAFIEDMDFPLFFGSIDVWYNPVDGYWGIFEYQPQFNPKHHDTKDIREILEQMMDQLLDLQVKEEASKPFGFAHV